MSELDDAIIRLEAAVVRLEGASSLAPRGCDDERVAAIAARIDSALARLALLLDRED